MSNSCRFHIFNQAFLWVYATTWITHTLLPSVKAPLSFCKQTCRAFPQLCVTSLHHQTLRLCFHMSGRSNRWELELGKVRSRGSWNTCEHETRLSMPRPRSIPRWNQTAPVVCHPFFITVLVKPFGSCISSVRCQSSVQAHESSGIHWNTFQVSPSL